MEKFSYLNRPNLEYIEELYQKFIKDPESIGAEWRMFFEGVEFAQNLPAGGVSSKELDVYNLIKAYRDYGHFEANLNPLSNSLKSFPELSIQKFNLTDADMDQSFEIGAIIGRPKAKLREIIQALRQAYCGTLTVQFSEAMPTVHAWFVNEFEKENAQNQLSVEEKQEVLKQLGNAETFEKFLHTRYVGKKRFSVEGGDALLPMLETMLTKGISLGMEEIVLGMAHRGRLNVLANFMGKAYEMIFAEFEGHRDNHNSFYDGDVKYHNGYSVDRKTPNGNCHISMAYNPSHLEAVDPVVIGMVRAKQRRRRDTQERKKVVPVLIHGDAAFSCQGVVTETFQLSQLKGYTVGGTIHICVDNQIGFTTNPENSRSCPYPTDISKILQTPVLLVNGDDVEACVRAMDIAIRFRQEFKRDIVINVVCYRRFGHNEGDEPAYTQPLMYDKIKKHPTPFELYAKKLVTEKVIEQAYADSYHRSRIDQLQVLLDNTRKAPPAMTPSVFQGAWKGYRRATPEDFQKVWDTKVPVKTLQEVAKLLTSYPTGFTPHPKIESLIKQRTKMMEGNGAIDWGMAELLSYGSLLSEGNSVRLSGQDCVRGTFTHRQSSFYDVKTGERHDPLRAIRPDDVEFCVYDSPLSEYAVLGFEYGNSSSDPTFLTIWEAQFGDFANGAQIIIDQFIASAEQKWQRMSGLVMLLPHGFEGQGPEHSSARLERFLQLCAQYNMQVCNFTTPAQIFHALRRQMKRDFRMPLIVMSPKSLLRHPKVVSTLDDLANGHFHEVLGDTTATASKVETVVMCSGKVYYDILDGRDKADAKIAEKTAIVRVEQMYPFPEMQIMKVLKGYKNLSRVIWAQEEPKNMGAWSFMAPRLRELFDENGLEVALTYAGRTERASPACGYEKVHAVEQKEIVEACFTPVQKKSKK